MKWEYYSFRQTRSMAAKGMIPPKFDWEKDKPDLKNLGEQGWELIVVIPSSGVYPPNANNAGFTNEMTWIFKRPLKE